jgi:hypothetical protein
MLEMIVGRGIYQVGKGRYGWDEILQRTVRGVCGPQRDEGGQLPLPQAERAEVERAPEKRQFPRTEDEEWRGRDRERERGEEWEYRVT